MDINGLNGNTAVTAPSPAVPTELQAQHREVVQAVKAVNNAGMFGENNELQFQKDPQSHRMVVRLIDRQTKEVVSQIPPEYLLELAAQTKFL